MEYGRMDGGASPVVEVSLARRAPADVVPLTATQLHWWNRIEQDQGGCSERLCYVAQRVRGALDAEVLTRSIEAVMQRHESLRARIILRDGLPLQQFEPGPELRVDYIDLSAASSAATQELAARAEAFVKEKVLLTQGALLGVQLFKLSEADHVLILALEHMITDGVSNSILTCRRRSDSRLIQPV